MLEQYILSKVQPEEDVRIVTARMVVTKNCNKLRSSDITVARPTDQ